MEVENQRFSRLDIAGRHALFVPHEFFKYWNIHLYETIRRFHIQVKNSNLSWKKQNRRIRNIRPALSCGSNWWEQSWIAPPSGTSILFFAMVPILLYCLTSCPYYSATLSLSLLSAFEFAASATVARLKKTTSR